MINVKKIAFYTEETAVNAEKTRKLQGYCQTMGELDITDLFLVKTAVEKLIHAKQKRKKT